MIQPTRVSSKSQKTTVVRERPHIEERIHVIQISQTVPACRLVHIETFAVVEPDGCVDSGHTVAAVLTIETRIFERWSRSVRDGVDVPECRNADEYRKLGFHFQHRDVESGVLFVEAESGEIVSSLDNPFAIDLGIRRIIPCSWPRDDDSTRLVPMVAAMEKEAVELLARHQKGSQR